jgi:hypothetical protein
MPSVSKKQHNFMAFKAHDKTAPLSLQKAAKHYLEADKKKKGK